MRYSKGWCPMAVFEADVDELVRSNGRLCYSLVGSFDQAAYAGGPLVRQPTQFATVPVSALLPSVLWFGCRITTRIELKRCRGGNTRSRSLSEVYCPRSPQDLRDATERADEVWRSWAAITDPELRSPGVDVVAPDGSDRMLDVVTQVTAANILTAFDAVAREVGEAAVTTQLAAVLSELFAETLPATLRQARPAELSLALVEVFDAFVASRAAATGQAVSVG